MLSDKAMASIDNYMREMYSVIICPSKWRVTGDDLLTAAYYDPAFPDPKGSYVVKCINLGNMVHLHILKTIDIDVELEF